MIELKPCPFCGGESEYVWGSERDACFVDCEKGCCSEMWWDTEEGAAKAWNTRADDINAAIYYDKGYEKGRADADAYKEEYGGTP